MSREYTLSEKEKMELLNSRNNNPYKMQGHSFTQRSHIGKQVCKNGGLVGLRNQATEWCIDKGCNYEDHPQYISSMKRLTKRQW